MATKRTSTALIAAVLALSGLLLAAHAPTEPARLAAGAGAGRTPTGSRPGPSGIEVAPPTIARPLAISAPPATTRAATGQAALEPDGPPAGAHTHELSAAGGGCGPGFILATGASGAICLHSDPTAVAAGTSSPSSVRATRIAPKCYGNGVNGNRFQLVYVHVEGRPNRAATYIPRILREWTPSVEGAFRSTSKAQGRELGIRFHAPGCKISVGVVALAAADADTGDFRRLTSAIFDTLVDAGYNQESRKYLVWYDGASGAPVCGVAAGRIISGPPLPIGPDDNPTPVNRNNTGNLPVFGGSIAIAFRTSSPQAPDTAITCWGQSAMGAGTETHELLHALGAVQLSSPNSNGLGHCTDGNDIMCYPEGGKRVYAKCITKIPMLDCGSDDYFHANPAKGSYLATHWNTANSSFLGDTTIDDAIPIELPRP